MEALTLIQETRSISEMANICISAIKEGEVEPLVAYINLSKLAKVIDTIKDDTDVRDIALRELAKYGKRATFGDTTLEEAEVGVRYDFSGCGDSKLAEMYAVRDRILADIKDREKMLKNIPATGMADAETGEVIYPAVKTSKTQIKVTIKKS